MNAAPDRDKSRPPPWLLASIASSSKRRGAAGGDVPWNTCTDFKSTITTRECILVSICNRSRDPSRRFMQSIASEAIVRGIRRELRRVHSRGNVDFFLRLKLILFLFRGLSGTLSPGDSHFSWIPPNPSSITLQIPVASVSFLNFCCRALRSCRRRRPLPSRGLPTPIPTSRSGV